MLVGGIVAEFNPFHNGHAALCNAARRSGATHLVAVMSGNFAQRGDFAVAEKRLRTACALRSGVDLVLELPVARSVATAQVFAAGAVELLAACGCVDRLCFGSESGNARALTTLARVVDDPSVSRGLRENLAQGMTFAKARELAVEASYGKELSEMLHMPNDLLGVEYLRHAAAIGWEPELFTIRRKGVSHDAKEGTGSFASAGYLRDHADDTEVLAGYMPASALELLMDAERRGAWPVRGEKLESAILTHLRRLDKRDLALLPDLSEGLENRMYAAIRASGTLQELKTALKTKRYTMARVRRLILSAFLGIGSRDARYSPPYLRVLGANLRGRELLPVIGRNAALPVDTSLAKLKRRGGACSDAAALEARATDLYTLAMPRPLPCGYDYSAGFVT